MPRVSAKPKYINEITRLYLEEKLSLGEISQAIPISVQTMSRWLTEDGVQLEARPRNPNAGRTAEQQAEINEKIKATYQAKAEAGIKQRGRARTIPRETRQCPVCPNTFEVPENSPKQFCSMHCARFDQARRVQEETRKAWEASEKSLCACGEGRIPYEHRDTWKYCSPECRETYGGKRQANPENWVVAVCENASCPRDEGAFTYPRSQGHRKYCSDLCSQAARRRNTGTDTNGDDTDSAYETLFSGLCGVAKLPAERVSGDEQIPVGNRGSYAPDFKVTFQDKTLWVETKAARWVKPDSPAKWAAWRTEKGRLCVLMKEDLDQLYAGMGAKRIWLYLSEKAIDQAYS
jgi:hypothetical protein